MMNIQELATAAEHQLNIKIILMNNQALGMVYQQQDLFLKIGYLLQLILIRRILLRLLLGLVSKRVI